MKSQKLSDLKPRGRAFKTPRDKPWTEEQLNTALSHVEEAQLALGQPQERLMAMLFGGEQYHTIEARREAREAIEDAATQLSEALATLEGLS